LWRKHTTEIKLHKKKNKKKKKEKISLTAPKTGFFEKRARGSQRQLTAEGLKCPLEGET